MRTESEIRNRLENLIERMKAIKAYARDETSGTPNYENHLIYGELMNDIIKYYRDVTLLLWVLNEPETHELDLLTRLNPADEERSRKLVQHKSKKV